MGAVSRWAVNRPKTAIIVWLAMVLVVAGLAFGVGGRYNDSFSLPDTESSRAQALLGQIPGAKDSLTATTSKVVWSHQSDAAKSDGVKTPVMAMLTTISSIPSVACVTTPYGDPLGSACPKAATSAASSAGSKQAAGQTSGAQAAPTPPPAVAKVLAGLGSAGFSVDGHVGYATVEFKGSAVSLSTADAQAVLAAVTSTNGSGGLTVGANGQALEFAGVKAPSSEGIGITVALVILLFTFGSFVGAFLPVLSAVVSLGVAQALVLLTANFLDVATFAPTLAAMIGLGVGIDYSVFVINRFKQALDAGREPRPAALEAARTSGRAVVFAAATVVIALLGLFVMRINFFNGLAVASAATVIVMMIGATVLLPAVLSLLGRKAFALKAPWARKPKAHNPEGGLFARYGRWLERHYRVVGALAMAAIVVIALPVGSLRLGFPDDSGKAPTKPARIAYDLLSEGFGPGINGPFVVAVETAKAGDNASVQQLAADLGKDPGVAAAIAFPMGADSSITAMQVIPASGPQDAATTELLDRLRATDIPASGSAAAVKAYVGGMQAITSDFTTVLRDALPMFLLVVIGLGFLALVLLFRSVLVPLTGAITSLISLSAAMGVTVAVFQWGWLGDVFGVPGTGPIMPFLPIMVFAILFGLSMDYQVFLVSRMQEEWAHTQDNRKAVRRGLAASGRVVAIAAAIMFSVFAAFAPATVQTIKLFGVALSAAVLFDAFLIRLIIVPSLMYQFGKANWWLPRWLGRVLPQVAVESEDDVAYEESEFDDIPEDGEMPAVAGKMAG